MCSGRWCQLACFLSSSLPRSHQRTVQRDQGRNLSPTVCLRDLTWLPGIEASIPRTKGICATRVSLVLPDECTLNHGSSAAGLAEGYFGDNVGLVDANTALPADGVAVMFDDIGAVTLRTMGGFRRAMSLDVAAADRPVLDAGQALSWRPRGAELRSWGGRHVASQSESKAVYKFCRRQPPLRSPTDGTNSVSVYIFLLEDAVD